MARSDDSLPSRIGKRIKSAREDSQPHSGARPIQDWLGDLVRRTGAHISALERGREIPNLQVLCDVYAALRDHADRKGSDSDLGDLSGWLIDWLSDRAERDIVEHGDEAMAALRMIGGATRGHAKRDGPLRSIADFPGDAQFTVIIGDRRELRATSAADCFIYSLATTDVMYLNYLGSYLRDAAIRTDKLLVRMGTEYLEGMADLSQRNLLIIGSPAVNWGARILNSKHTLFPFRIEQEIARRDEIFRHDSRFRDPKFASSFWEMAQSIEVGQETVDVEAFQIRAAERGQDSELVAEAAALVAEILENLTAKRLMKQFAGIGFVDVADRANHGIVTYGSNDFATVSLAPNPWDSTGRYRAVVCGGIHGPGTAAALRELLLRPERFVRHPLGAILEIELNPDLDWATRFEKATVSFQTREYAPEQILQQLEDSLSKSDDPADPMRLWLTGEELESRIQFVRSLL